MPEPAINVGKQITRLELRSENKIYNRRREEKSVLWLNIRDKKMEGSHNIKNAAFVN